MKYYIKERHNPQLGIYYLPCGKMAIKEAKKYEKSCYGYNYMLKFDTKEEYDAKIKELKDSGEKVHEF